MKSKEEIKKDADRVAAFFGYNIHALSLDVINVKDSYCNGYVNGYNDAKKEKFHIEENLSVVANDNKFVRQSKPMTKEDVTCPPMRVIANVNIFNCEQYFK